MGGQAKKAQEEVMGALRRKFRPEFLNRIDDIVIFDALTRKDMDFIFDIQMNDGKDFARHARAIGDNASPGSAVFIADIKPKLVALTGTASNAAGGATTTTGQGSLFLSEVIVGDRQI